MRRVRGSASVVTWPSVTDVATKASEQPKTDSSETSTVAPTGVLGQVFRALSEFVADLVKADGGELYLVSATNDDVHLHLTGTCAGCPGATMTRERLLEPAVRGALPKASVKVTTGWTIPEGARKVE